MQTPNCCGSEDGDLVCGVDSGREASAMVHVWKCNTCGVLTVVSSVVVTN
jgi:hypothetical protein